MSNNPAIYIDLEGMQWSLKDLDQKERRVLADFRKHAEGCQCASGDPAQRWCDFDNYRLPKIIALYESRGVSRSQIIRMPLYKIAQDMSGRLGIALGVVRKPDYRCRLSEIIDSRFKTRREFCEATGLSEDMLSHVLAGRKDLSMEALSKALERIGYTILFVLSQPVKTNKSA
jgi:transcriptional regulator with XRE-family HTH domain